MNITAIKRGFVFQFQDKVNSKGEFERESSAGGIILTTTVDDSAKQPRWVNVVSAGGTCTFVKDGDQVLLPNLRWTAASKLDDERIWKSDELQAAAVVGSDGSLVPCPSYVIFTQNKKGIQRTAGLLVVVGNPEDTPTGDVVSIGENVDPELIGSKIYYSDVNFTNTFTHHGIEYAFIKDEDILAYEPK